MKRGILFLTVGAFLLQAPGPECWAAGVRALARPGAGAALRPGAGFSRLAAPLLSTTPGLSALTALTLSPITILAAPPVVTSEGPVAIAQLAAFAPALEGSSRGEREVGAALPQLFDGAGPRAAESEFALAAGEAPQAPRANGLGRPASPRFSLAVVREMAFGQPEIAPLVRPYRFQMNVARAMLIFKAGLSTALAFSVGALVDAAIAHALTAAGLWLGAIAAITVVKAVNQRFYAVVSGNLRIRVRNDVRMKLFAGLVGLSDAGEDPAQLAARLTSDITRVTVKNVTIPILFPHLVIQFVLATAFVIKASPLMAAVIVASLPLLSWLAWRNGRRSAALQEQAALENADMTRVGAEILAQAPLPQDQRAPAVTRYGGVAGRFEKTILSLIGLGANFDALCDVLQVAFTEFLVLGVGLLGFILTGSPSVGQVMSLRGYAKDLRGVVRDGLDAYTDGKEAEGGTRRILELLRRIEPAK